MKKGYTDERNAQILISLMKKMELKRLSQVQGLLTFVLLRVCSMILTLKFTLQQMKDLLLISHVDWRLKVERLLH